MSPLRRSSVLVAALALLSVVGSGIGTAQTPSGSEVVVLSNSSPHVSVIDTTSHEVTRTADIPDFTAWSWNDDNNHYDGMHLWLGLLDPDSKVAEVISLELDALEVGHRIALGQEDLSLYIGSVASDGILHVGKMGSGQIAWLDTASGELVKIVDVPVNGGVVCDVTVGVGPDGVERVFYPTWEGDTVVAVAPDSGEVLALASTPSDTGPWMSSLDHQGRLWVQEGTANTNAIFDSVTLDLIERVSTGQGPVGVTFSPDGGLAYITYIGDSVVTVIDTASFETIKNVEVGTSPLEVAVDPGGQVIYTIVTQEGLVGVIDTATWEVIDRIPLGTKPNGIFLRSLT